MLDIKGEKSMKKLLALLLAGVMVLGCVACGQKEQSTEIKDAHEILTKVWDNYNETASDDWKFPIGGGNAELMIMDAPGGFDLTLEGAKDELMYTYCIPEDAIAMVDNAATAMNMMMSNNFTSAAYHVTDTANVKTVIEGIKNATLNNQWMCGMPEQFFIATVGDNYVVSAFGLAGVIDIYKTALTTVYGSDATVVVEETIAE